MTTTIPVVAAWATGPTPIAAFDAALTDGGVGDVNIVSLSSIIPPAHRVEVVEGSDLEAVRSFNYGDLAWCVMAEERATSGSVAAGLAWANDKAERGGVFLEAHGSDLDVVRAELEEGIVDLMRRRPKLDFGPASFSCASGQSDGPSSALVVALFEARSFNQAEANQG